MCVLPIAYSRRLPPIRNAFQLDKIPSTPPITSKIPAHLPCHALVIASAVARVEFSAWTSGKVVPTLQAIPTYHSTATTIETIKNLPILGRVKSISSAACGMTSKPTNIKGTMTITAMIPPTPPMNAGACIEFEVSGLNKTAPMNNNVPTNKMPNTAVFWNQALTSMPRIFSQVTMTDPSIPTPTQVAYTSHPAMVQRYPWL